MRYLAFLFLILLSCRTRKEAPALREEPPVLHGVAYEMTISPAGKYQAVITYLDYKGNKERNTTLGDWKYEFNAKAGTTVQAEVTLKPINPTEKKRGMVNLSLKIDGNVVESGVGEKMSVEYTIE